MEYRNLLEYEIAQLEASGCTATNWNTVSVKDGFNPSCYIRVNFSGNVKLGNTRDLFVRNGVPVRSGIYDATIHNCEIGDNVHISKIGEAIANYRSVIVWQRMRSECDERNRLTQPVYI